MLTENKRRDLQNNCKLVRWWWLTEVFAAGEEMPIDNKAIPSNRSPNFGFFQNPNRSCDRQI